MRTLPILFSLGLIGLLAGCATPPPEKPAVRRAGTQEKQAYLRNPTPRYPVLARANGIDGTVRVYMKIDTRGKPSHIGIEKSSGSSLLDAAALETCSKWVFRPSRDKRGQAMAAEISIPIRFDLTKPPQKKP